MRHRWAVALVTAGVLVLALPVTGSATALQRVASATHTLVMRHTAVAPHARATAQIRKLNGGLYHIQIMARGLPLPAHLHVTPLRHIYRAWAYDGKDTHRPERAIALTYQRSTDTYAADGRVSLGHLTELFITADATGTQRTPTAPEVSVLSSVGELNE